MGSRGSVIPFFQSLKEKDKLPITDPRMTRFMISLEQGVELVWHAFEDMFGGEIYVKKIPSMNIIDLANVVVPSAEHEIVGIRPGEKLHEQMIGEEDSASTYEYKDHFKILPATNTTSTNNLMIGTGKLVSEDFSYSSDNNKNWMSISSLKSWIEDHRATIGKF